MFKSVPNRQAQVLSQIPDDELVVEIPHSVRMMHGRKV